MRGRWLTPASLPSSTIQCVIEFPDSEEIRALVRGALYLLSQEENYEEFGAVSAEEISDAMRQTLFLFNLEGCMLIPVGGIIAFAAGSTPAGFLLCNGQEVSRTDYAALYNEIGTFFGAGDDSTTFNVPDLRQRVPVGRDTGDIDFFPLGKAAGEKNHTLTVSEIPVHTHVQNAHTHTQNAHTHTQNAHDHTVQGTSEAAGSGVASNKLMAGSGTNIYKNTTGGLVSMQGEFILAATPTIQNATPTNQNATPTNQNTGGGEEHNNLPPYLILNYIIKF